MWKLERMWFPQTSQCFEIKNGFTSSTIQLQDGMDKEGGETRISSTCPITLSIANVLQRSNYL